MLARRRSRRARRARTPASAGTPQESSSASRLCGSTSSAYSTKPGEMVSSSRRGPAAVSTRPWGNSDPGRPTRRHRRRRGYRDRGSRVAARRRDGRVRRDPEQHLVAGGGLGRVADADHLPQLDRHRDRVLEVPAALAGVGVERGLAREALEHQVQVPGQGHGVADPRAHALPGERRHQMRGVSREQHPALPPALRPAGAERVDGVPLERDLVGGDPGAGEQVPHEPRLFDLLGGLARQQHPLPAPAPGPPETSVVGRAGSHRCRLTPASSAGSFGTVSAISQSNTNPRSSTGVPM